MAHHADADEVFIPDPKTESKSSVDPNVLPPYWSAMAMSGACAGVWASGFVGNHPTRARFARRFGKMFFASAMVSGLTDPVAGHWCATLFSVWMAGAGVAAGTYYRKSQGTPMWLSSGAALLGTASAGYHYRRWAYYHELSHRYPFFKHDFPRKDYKGIDAE